MTHASPLYADICNYLVTSTYLIGVSKAIKERLESDAKYYILNDPYLWRLCNDQVMRMCISESNRSSTSITQRLKEAIMDQCKWPEKSLIVGYIGPPYIETHIISKSQSSLKPEELNAPIAYIVLRNFQHLGFGVPKVLINDQGIHFYNHAMAKLLEKYGVVHRVTT
ncbi:hypothetical protein CR513_31692, partial [Mucuna pruriens]